jgi:hypothetical protein
MDEHMSPMFWDEPEAEPVYDDDDECSRPLTEQELADLHARYEASLLDDAPF